MILCYYINQFQKEIRFMNKFSINIFLSQIGRLSVRDVQKLVEEHLDDLQKMSIVDANQIFNFVENKFKIVSG